MGYTYDELCGYMDSPYHTGYDPKEVYYDVYKVENKADAVDPGLKVTCIEGHESGGSIGAEDVFHRKIGKMMSDGITVESFEAFDFDEGRSAKIYDEYNKEMSDAVNSMQVANTLAARLEAKVNKNAEKAKDEQSKEVGDVVKTVAE